MKNSLCFDLVYVGLNKCDKNSLEMVPRWVIQFKLLGYQILSMLIGENGKLVVLQQKKKLRRLFQNEAKPHWFTHIPSLALIKLH